MAEDVGVVVGVAAVPGGEVRLLFLHLLRLAGRGADLLLEHAGSLGARVAELPSLGAREVASLPVGDPIVRALEGVAVLGGVAVGGADGDARATRASARERVVIATRRETRRARIAGGAATRAAPEATVRVDVRAR